MNLFTQPQAEQLIEHNVKMNECLRTIIRHNMGIGSHKDALNGQLEYNQLMHSYPVFVAADSELYNLDVTGKD